MYILECYTNWFTNSVEITMTTPLLCVMCVMKHEELDFYVPGAVPSHFIDDCY